MLKRNPPRDSVLLPKSIFRIGFCLLVFAFGLTSLFAAPVAFSGKLAINGLNYDGTAKFTFALRDANGTVHWRNGADANASINVPVDRGQYLVLLGGQGMNPLPGNLFLDHSELFLQVHFFRPDTQQWLHLQPDQPITSAPHALSAAMAQFAIHADEAKRVEPGAITKNMLAPGVLDDLNASSVGIDGLPPEVRSFLAPRILTQPPAQVTGYAGRSILIPAVADGRQLSYQWRKGDSPVAGATSPILHLSDLNASTDPGSYSLVVTNPFGSVTSSATQLTVATVVPVDVDRPVLNLNGPKSISLLTDSNWTDPGYSATDDLDGDLTAMVDVNGTVNVSTPGAYFITYKATDSAGNFATAQRLVTVSNFTDLCLIPAGSFMMGYPPAVPPNSQAYHEVYLSAFYMGKYEVTKTIWDEVRLWATDPARGANVYQFDNNGTAEGPDHPVANVTWYDLVKWCNARSEKENLQPLYYREANQTTIYRYGQILLTNAHVNWQANGWRLPTDAEWEKAARGGLVGIAYPHGITYSPAYGNIIESGIGKTVPVGSYPPNDYGLHDTFGNVREIVWDGKTNAWYSQPEASLPNPHGAENGTRVLRGSSYLASGSNNANHNRGGQGLTTTSAERGFRLARNAPDAVAGGYPTLTSSPDANGTAGQAFSYQILAGNSPAAYGAAGLPAGLSVNAATGLIAGTVNAVGDHNVTISAANAAGTTSMTLGIRISSGVSVSLAAGSEHTLFVDLNGTLWAVGNNSGARLGDGTTTHRFSSVKVFDENVTAVSTGTSHSFLIDRKGALWGWGAHQDGRLGISEEAPYQSPTIILDANVSFVSAGHEQSMFVKKDGSLWGMGRNHYGQLGDGGVEDRYFTPFRIVEANVTAVDVGFSQHSLFLKSDGSLWGVGRNHNGQLGDGTTVDRNSSVQIVDANVTAIAVGSNHSLFTKLDGSLWAMGGNGNGRLGDGTNVDRHVPIQVVDANVTAIAAGSAHSLFIKSDHTLWAMGVNTGGRLGDGTTIERRNPVQVASNVMRAAAGNEHSIYQKLDGSLWAMGRNHSGQLNDGTIILRNSPIEFVDGNVTSVSAGNSHGLFVKTNGSLWSVGSNNSGKLGNSSAIHSSIPLEILEANVTEVSGGGDHSLFLKADGSLWAMGKNANGQLGDGTTTNRTSPVSVSDANVTAVDAKSTHSLFIKADGSLWAMGGNQYGQLGDGSTASRTSPVQIVDANVSVVSTGAQHTLFIKSDGSLWGMGRNVDGRLGDGTTTNRLTPVRSIDSNVTAVATGVYFSLFLKSDGSLWGMGYNLNGQLGDGTTSSRAVPVRIVESGVAGIAAGNNYSFFVKDNGSLWGMGFNAYGQLGDGTTIDRHVPVQILSYGVAEVSAGQYFTWVRMTDGSLRSMGSDRYGQLGLGRTFYRATPLQVAIGLLVD